MNGDLIEYEKLRKLCDKYNIDVDIFESGITLSPKKSKSFTVYNLTELDIYLVGYGDGIYSCKQE